MADPHRAFEQYLFLRDSGLSDAQAKEFTAEVDKLLAGMTREQAEHRIRAVFRRYLDHRFGRPAGEKLVPGSGDRLA